MFDPTIYDNLKTVLEGEIYDRDLAGHLLITERSDTVDLAVMSREIRLRFRLRQKNDQFAEIRLHASALDLTGEIAETNEEGIGCRLFLTFIKEIAVEYGLALKQCAHMRTILTPIWGDGVTIHQRLIGQFPEEDGKPLFECRLSVDFLRKISERQIDDIPRLVDSVIQSLEQL